MEGSEEKQQGLFVVMDILWHNKRVGNNDLEMTHSIRCSTKEIAENTLALLKDIQPYTVGHREGIPDELVVKMNHSPIGNLWKLARQLDDDKALLAVRLEKESPEPPSPDDVVDLVYNHTSIVSAGGFSWW